jgi:hypothetical protein
MAKNRKRIVKKVHFLMFVLSVALGQHHTAPGQHYIATEQHHTAPEQHRTAQHQDIALHCAASHSIPSQVHPGCRMAPTRDTIPHEVLDKDARRAHHQSLQPYDLNPYMTNN